MNVPTKLPFPLKLHLLLEKEPAFVQWTSARTFRIVNANPTILKEILPKFCRSASMTSFTRNLNMYGFKKLVSGPFSGSYYHPQFKQGETLAIQQMKRKPQRSKMKPRFTTVMPTIFEMEIESPLEGDASMPRNKENEMDLTPNATNQCAGHTIEILPSFNSRKTKNGEIESTSDQNEVKPKRVRFQLDAMPHQECKPLKMEKGESSSSISATTGSGRVKCKEILSQFRKPSTKSFAQVVANRHNPWRGGKMPSFNYFQEDALSRCDMISVKRKVENRKRKLDNSCDRLVIPTLDSLKRRRQLQLQPSLQNKKKEENLTPMQIQALEIFANLGSKVLNKYRVDHSLFDIDIGQEFQNSRRVAIITR